MASHSTCGCACRNRPGRDSLQADETGTDSMTSRSEIWCSASAGPAQRAQTIGLEEGQKSSTIGASLGGGFLYGLYKGLGLEANYQYGFVLTHYTGQANRNTSITSADRGNATHLITLGLAYNY